MRPSLALFRLRHPEPLAGDRMLRTPHPFPGCGGRSIFRSRFLYSLLYIMSNIACAAAASPEGGGAARCGE
jgi:hypothetical protein